MHKALRLISRPGVCIQSVSGTVAGGIALKGGTNLSGSSPRAKFPHGLRLLRHADFERVYKQGRRHFAAHMTVFYLPRAEAASLRVGFTVSRVLGGAVDRNRMKRRLREAVRLQRPGNFAAVDIVINPKKSLLKADFTEIQQEIARAFAVIQKGAKS